MKLDFSVAVHSLLYLAQIAPQKLTSRQLAGSLNINPVMIRNILSELNKQGYIIGKVGKNGGYQLKRQLSEMNIGDLYDLTIPPALSYARFTTGRLATDTDATPISANIGESLTDLFTLADAKYRRFYHQFTLADLQKDIEEHGYFKRLVDELGGAEND